MAKFFLIPLLSILFWSLLLFLPPTNTVPPSDTGYNITDESGRRLLMRVSVKVNPGDELLLDNNNLYRVTKVEGTHAYARFVKTVLLH